MGSPLPESLSTHACLFFCPHSPLTLDVPHCFKLLRPLARTIITHHDKPLSNFEFAVEMSVLSGFFTFVRLAAQKRYSFRFWCLLLKLNPNSIRAPQPSFSGINGTSLFPSNPMHPAEDAVLRNGLVLQNNYQRFRVRALSKALGTAKRRVRVSTLRW